MHLLSEPVDLPPGVAKDNGLSDGNGLVEIAERVKLPLFLLDSNIELLDTFKGQLIALDKNSDGITHELLGDLEDISRHGGGEENDLGILGKELEDWDSVRSHIISRISEGPTFVDLVLESTGQHLVGLIKTENLDAIGPESPAVDHIKHPSWGTDDDMDALLELGHILANIGASDASVALDVHVIAKGDDNFLNLLSQLAGRGENESLGALDRHIQL